MDIHHRTLSVGGGDGRYDDDRETKEDVDVPFSTIIDNLDMALMGHFDMRNDRWVIASDLVFVDLENSEDVTTGTTLGR